MRVEDETRKSIIEPQTASPDLSLQENNETIIISGRKVRNMYIIISTSTGDQFHLRVCACACGWFDESYSLHIPASNRL